jgi:membrane protein
MSLTTVRLREAWNWGGLSVRELAVRTYQAMDKHDTLNQAAVIAYFAMLALVPFLSLTLVLALGARTGVADQLKSLSGQWMLPEAKKIIGDQIDKIQSDTPVGLISLSVVILLWSASSMFVAVMDATNASYEVRDGRPWWKKRLLAIVMTMVETILLVGASACITLGPELLAWLPLGDAARWGAMVLQWFIVVVALLAAFATAYYFGPHVDQEWEWITPGSALGVLTLIIASLGFRMYLLWNPSYSATYGVLGGSVLMLLWLYLAGLALLVGAEINCVIEHAAPHGREPGQKKAPA